MRSSSTTCEQCDREFASRAGRETHMWREHRGTSTDGGFDPLVCRVCDRTFNSAQGRATHEWREHPTGVRRSG